MTIRPKDRKLGELVLFISERSEGDPRFGAGKLSKLLFYSDFAAYLTLGKSITGQQYRKTAAGPAPQRLDQVRRALIARGELAVRHREAGRRRQDRPFALRSAQLAEFSADEIALVAGLIQRSWEYDDTQTGYFSSDSAHWDNVPESQTIPYEFALLSKRPASANDRKRCELLGPLAAAVLSGKRTVVPLDEKTFFGPGVRKSARGPRTARASNPGKSKGADAKAPNRSRIRRANQRRSSALVRANARRD